MPYTFTSMAQRPSVSTKSYPRTLLLLVSIHSSQRYRTLRWKINRILMPLTGHYKAEQHDPQSNTFNAPSDLLISISVDEVFDNDHRVVNQKGSSSGKFTFSAADAGDHKICFTPSGSVQHSGWLSTGQPIGGIKMNLDLAIGETSQIESTDKTKIQDIVQRVKDLNGRLQDIRREQVFQRVRLSKSDNFRSCHY